MSLFDPDAELQLSDNSMDTADQDETSDTVRRDQLSNIPADLSNLKLTEDRDDAVKDRDIPQRDTDTGDSSDQILSDENDIRWIPLCCV